MKISRYVRSYLFFIVIALLVVSIGISAFAFYTISKKNDELSAANNTIKTTSEQLKQTQEQLSNEQTKNQELTTSLENSQKENEELKQKNNEYVAEIERLKNEKKKAEAIIALGTPSSQPTYPEPTKVCYLTFDDGPSNNTLRILDILRNYNVKATFFVIGAGKLEYLPNIHNEGHAIGVHSDTHSYSQIYSSVDAYLADFNSISNKIEAAIGIRPKIMRFPGGSNNTVSKKYCSGIMSELTRILPEQGYAYFDWNVSSGDAEKAKVNKNRIVSNVLKYAKNKNSMCLLMHDAAAKTTTADALPEIIEGLKMQGYSFDILTEQSFGYHFAVNN